MEGGREGGAGVLSFPSFSKLVTPWSLLAQVYLRPTGVFEEDGDTCSRNVYEGRDARHGAPISTQPNLKLPKRNRCMASFIQEYAPVTNLFLHGPLRSGKKVRVF